MCRQDLQTQESGDKSAFPSLSTPTHGLGLVLGSTESRPLPATMCQSKNFGCRGLTLSAASTRQQGRKKRSSTTSVDERAQLVHHGAPSSREKLEISLAFTLCAEGSGCDEGDIP
ncbi:hypothetical protein FA13DRAFT_1738327 [Coprinellus micaceus]|uniref:Uncharacterized protein n=1 Tax=Coprinellus micaceus TaxID=71717 RepID=A0A4Y7SU52_COPMI|nr:hypothetical protein FA13DRAFT_1738327 [Coprinellus micaceus]